MKARLVLLAVLGLLLTTSVALAANSGIIDTAHNFTANSELAQATGQSDELCAACHVPHNAKTTVGTVQVSGVLWANDYGVPGGITGQSNVLCMSCHDGSLAASGNPGYTFPVGSTAAFTGNLGDSHPVDRRLDASKPGYKAPTQYAKLDSEGKVTCASCHDPHVSVKSMLRTGAAGGTATGNANSILCLDCHVK